MAFFVPNSDGFATELKTCCAHLFGNTHPDGRTP